MIECWLVDKPQKQKKTMNDFQFLEEDICAVFENKLYFLNSHNVKSLLSFYPPPPNKLLFNFYSYFVLIFGTIRKPVAGIMMKCQKTNKNFPLNWSGEFEWMDFFIISFAERSLFEKFKLFSFTLSLWGGLLKLQVIGSITPQNLNKWPNIGYIYFFVMVEGFKNIFIQ